VKTLLGEKLMVLTNSANDQEVIEAATDIGHLLVKFDKNDIAREQLENEKHKVELANQKLQLMKGSVKGLKEEVAQKELTPEQLQQKLDEIYGIGA
jgi:DNA-binding LytR/AlgR family response regulator